MPQRLAPLWTGQSPYRPRNTPGPLSGASRPGKQLLPRELPMARLAVEMAWGADLAGDPDLWSWTDITGDMRDVSGVSFTFGRPDEASVPVPASGSVTVDNQSRRYSLGGISPNWPNVRANVPIRFRVDPDGTGFQVAFQGNVTGFDPMWDTTGDTDVVVVISIQGTKQRLIRGRGNAKRSAPRRYYTQAVNFPPLVYYPLDEGSGARSGTAVIGTGSATLDPNYLFNTGDSTVKYFGQGKLAHWLPEGVQLNKLAVLRGEIPKTPALTEWWVLDLLVSYAEGDLETGLSESVGVLENESATWSVSFDGFNKEIGINGYVVGAGPVLLSTTTFAPLFDGDVHHVRIWVDQAGTDVNIVCYVDDGIAAFATQTNQTLRHPDSWFIFASSNTKRYFGHVGWWNNISWAPFGGLASFLAGQGAAGEDAITRLKRLAVENRIRLDVIGEPATVDGTALMGPQPIAGTVDLFEECAVADQGVLFDGLSAGFTYVCREIRENADPYFTIDVAAQELAPEFKPVHKDARRLNLAYAKRSGGSEVVYEDVDGPLGTAAIGTYEGKIEVNLDADTRIGDYAGWIVHLGTVEGYRYPTLSVDIRAVPRLASAVLGVRPGHRIDLLNADLLSGHSDSTVTLLVEGVSMQITTHSWKVVLQCSLFDPWRIITLAADAGDTAETICHLDTDSSQTVDEVPADAVTMTVATDTGPLWTTVADDFPFYVTVGGIKTTVTAVAGAASPQTFTIDPMTLARPAFSPVEVWNPPVTRL